MATITQVQQQQQQQTRVRASEMERVMKEKEQIQLQLNTRTEELQHLRIEKEQLSTETEQLQAANTRADEQIHQLQQQVMDIIVTSSLCKACYIHGYHHTGPTTTAADKSKS